MAIPVPLHKKKLPVPRTTAHTPNRCGVGAFHFMGRELPLAQVELAGVYERGENPARTYSVFAGIRQVRSKNDVLSTTATRSIRCSTWSDPRFRIQAQVEASSKPIDSRLIKRNFVPITEVHIRSSVVDSRASNTYSCNALAADSLGM